MLISAYGYFHYIGKNRCCNMVRVFLRELIRNRLNLYEPFADYEKITTRNNMKNYELIHTSKGFRSCGKKPKRV